jgi:N-acetylneuraminic acid mutarotase
MTPENSPPRCYGCRLVYDSVNEKLLLWGGNIPSTTGKLDDWWSYDYPSNTWTRIETEEAPAGRYWQQMAFDPGVGKVLMFGGSHSGGSYGDTWLYDYALNEWTELEPSDSPPSRLCGVMVFDESIERIVLFGGLSDEYQVLGDTWVFDTASGEWSIVETGVPTAEEEDAPSSIPGFPVASIILAVFLFLALANSRN